MVESYSGSGREAIESSARHTPEGKGSVNIEVPPSRKLASCGRAAAIAVASCVSLAAPAGAQQRAELPERSPVESFEDVVVRLGSVRSSRGHLVRTILTRPKNATGGLPGVFLAPWLSCDPVEVAPGPGADGMMRLLHELARTPGLITMRVERPGIGDSEGPPCSEVDFETELAAFRAGFAAFTRHPDVDPARIVVLGLSNGGGYAPLVTDGHGVRGYVVIGGWSKTWLEHMLEHERTRLRLAGESPRSVSEAMKGYATVYDRFLNGRKTPAEVLRDHPELRPLWYGERDGLYGRSAAYHHQLQALNLADAWADVEADVLAIYGENDWIMSRDGHRRIVDLVNSNVPGAATLEVVPRMDHFLMLHDTMRDSFVGEPGKFAASVVLLVREWIRERTGLR